MALYEVKVPQLSESVAEATLLQWHKQVGEAVERDENLIDIETDKVVLELPAPGAGVLTQIIKGDGSKVAAGELIAMIDSEAAPTVIPEKKAASPQPRMAPEKIVPAAAVMPAAARMLAANNLSPGQIVGTGKGGRVTKQDVVSAIERKPPMPMQPALRTEIGRASCRERV